MNTAHADIVRGAARMPEAAKHAVAERESSPPTNMEPMARFRDRLARPPAISRAGTPRPCTRPRTGHHRFLRPGHGPGFCPARRVHESGYSARSRRAAVVAETLPHLHREDDEGPSDGRGSCLFNALRRRPAKAGTPSRNIRNGSRFRGEAPLFRMHRLRLPGPDRDAGQRSSCDPPLRMTIVVLQAHAEGLPWECRCGARTVITTLLEGLHGSGRR